jgi:hypothetical protein
MNQKSKKYLSQTHAGNKHLVSNAGLRQHINFLNWSKHHDEQRKLNIWKRIEKPDGLINYWAFSLVSNIHQRINLKSGVDFKLRPYNDLFLNGWFFHSCLLSNCFRP